MIYILIQYFKIILMIKIINIQMKFYIHLKIREKLINLTFPKVQVCLIVLKVL